MPGINKTKSNINHIMFSSIVFPFKTLLNKNNNKKNRFVVTDLS